MTHYAVLREYICTANPDGSIPLNSKVVVQIYGLTPALQSLINQANAAAGLMAALEDIQKRSLAEHSVTAVAIGLVADEALKKARGE